MKSKKITCTVGDLCSSISDTYKGKDECVVLVNTSDVLNGDVTNHNPVPNKNLKGQFKKTFSKGDILYSEIRPSNRRFAFIELTNTQNYIASTKLMVIRPDINKVDPKFLYYFLTSKSVLDYFQIQAETRSGTFPQITFSDTVAPYPICLPDIPTQKEIVSFIDSIDKKIKVNNQINDYLS